MSAWVNGQLDLDCSIDVLRRALANQMPQWADHIRVDPNGKLDMYRYSGAKNEPTWKRKDLTVHVLLPGSGNPNFPTPPGRSADNDWGFRRNADGTWQTLFADHNKGNAEDLANRIKAEVTKERYIALAKFMGCPTKVSKQGTTNTIEIELDEDQMKAFA